MENIQFEFRRAEIQSRCGTKIAKLAAWINEDPRITVALDSHEDDAEANDFVPGLGTRRAVAVRAALIEAGVSPERVSIGAFGNRGRLCWESSDACRAMNRRVEVLAAVR
jgi:peptidoglycan-associated lipoprotein